MLKLKTKGRSGVGIYPKMLTGYMLIIAVVLSMTAFMTYRLVRNYIIQTNETELVEKAQYIAITQKNGLEWKQLRRYQSLVDAKVVFVNPDYIATQSPPSPTSRKTPDEEDAAGLAYTEIVSNMDRRIFDGIFAGGTGNPYFSTDSAAALRASEIGADALLKATKVDGIYTADPKKDGSLKYETALEKRLKVMDSAAFALCMDNGIPIVVFDFFDGDALERVVKGEAVGTIVSDK